MRIPPVYRSPPAAPVSGAIPDFPQADTTETVSCVLRGEARLCADGLSPTPQTSRNLPQTAEFRGLEYEMEAY